MIILPSYEEEARMLPYLGCAQATHQTAPSCLWSYQQQAGPLRGCDVPLQRLNQSVVLALNFEDLDGLVRRACC
jgi:hypothetical protein